MPVREMPKRTASNPVEFDHEVIAERAYYLWEEFGRPHGNADQIWFEAERLVRQNGGEVRSARHTQPHAPARRKAGR